MKKTWKQKIEEKKDFPKVLTLGENFPCFKAAHQMGASAGDQIVLVNPSEITPLMAIVPAGKLITIREICKKIAIDHKVKACCPLTTGIFIMAIANAVEEEIAQGSDSALAKIPYWRTLKGDGFLNEKYPGGVENQKKLLEGEGFKILPRGRKYQVSDFEKYLISL
ncbi:MAG: MGMT family protein [Caldiserica bacterium]|nr:MGMT family protein [Caldisericota bacterium]MDH7562291.1 MGMT family protein [Caldisericota bacterium]